MPFGGMLGSTFNFVFETQLENLQNGDRFYYLAPHRGTELPHRAGEQLVRQAGHGQHRRDASAGAGLPDAGLILEVDQTRQFNGRVRCDGTGHATMPAADPISGIRLTPLVIRDNPATPGPDTNYLQYTGDEHVVLGGTAGNDILIASDRRRHALWRRRQRPASRAVTATTSSTAAPATTSSPIIGGDDIIHGEDGNDVIHGGNGDQPDHRRSGQRLHRHRRGQSEVFAGAGNDFILGADVNVPDGRQRGRRLDRDRDPGRRARRQLRPVRTRRDRRQRRLPRRRRLR